MVANVSAMKDVAVDRVLLRVGHGDGFTTLIDALSGYEFGAFVKNGNPIRLMPNLQRSVWGQ